MLSNKLGGHPCGAKHEPTRDPLPTPFYLEFVNFAVVSLHIHHGYIGAFLVGWSILTTGFGIFVMGEYNPWLALMGFLIGASLLIHDFHHHLSHRGEVTECER
jgi:hypothetical protein